MSNNDNYDFVPRTENLELPLPSEVDDPEDLRDEWGHVLDQLLIERLDTLLGGGEGNLDVDSLRAIDVNNEVSVLPLEGTLKERLEEAMDRIDGGIIRVPRPEDGEGWNWGDETLDINVEDFNGLRIKFDYGTRVNYNGDSWLFDVHGTESSQDQTFELFARHCDFDAADGNPEGFLRATDSGNIRINANTRNFENERGTSTCVLLRNKNVWTESFHLEGNFRACDRGVDFETPEQTGGSGTRSFADGRTEDLSVTFNDFGIRARGTHRVQHDNIRLFPREDNAVCLLLDGNLGNTVFISPRFDDTTGVDAIGIETTENYTGGNSPVMINPRWSDIDTRVVRYDESSDDVWVWLADEMGSRMSLENLGRGGINISQNGNFRIHDADNEEVFRIGNGGDIERMRQFDTLPILQEGIGFQSEDLTERSPETGQEVAWHDGSGDISEGLCFWVSGNDWYSIRDEETF